MATPVLIPVEEYLNTTYRPDRDYVGGELKERNVGETPHSALQMFFGIIFYKHRNEWGLRAFSEQRVQISEDNYRIADVCVLRISDVPVPIVYTAPVICIEILSRGDSLTDMYDRVDDYLSIGVQNVWLLDPIRRRAWIANAGGLQKLTAEEFSIPGTPVRVPLAELYAELDDMAAGR